MKKQERLRKPSEFERVRSQGQCWEHPLVVLCALPNGLPFTRFGFVASRRIGRAVARNRARRLMREVMRLKRGAIQDGWDLVLIARHRAPQSNYWEMEEAIAMLCQRAGVLKDGEVSGSEPNV